MTIAIAIVGGLAIISWVAWCMFGWMIATDEEYARSQDYDEGPVLFYLFKHISFVMGFLCTIALFVLALAK